MSLLEQWREYAYENQESEQQAHKLLGEIMQQGIPLIKYELREPTLNEIFIERVGETNEN